MKKTFHIFFLCQVISFCLTRNVAFAQDTKSIVETLYSNALKETREIEVHLPQGYKAESAKKYDVIYVLDGEDIADLVEQIENIAGKNELLPHFIIVGVHNLWLQTYKTNSRDRDFLPVHDDDFPVSGGADNFLSFFEYDLIPYINKKYPSDGRNTLFGHSYGGLLAVYTALTHPAYLNHISPQIHPCGGITAM